MLYTNLRHIESSEDQDRILGGKDDAVIICGRMEPGSILMYRIIEELQSHYRHVNFYDLEYDNPLSGSMLQTWQTNTPIQIPMIGFYKKGYLLNAFSGIQSKVQLAGFLEQNFSTKSFD